MRKIILASGSPRRRELMTEAGLEFQVEISHKEEEIGDWTPEETVCQLSLQKAQDIAGHHDEDCIIIGSDTVVAYAHQILGKPKDAEDAFHMIKMLQGDVHQVYTGVTIISGDKDHRQVNTFAEKTDVLFYPMSDETIRQYIETGFPDGPNEKGMLSWQDKAGAYGIQDGFGKRYIKGIHGDFYTVMGLPIGRLCHELEKAQLI